MTLLTLTNLSATGTSNPTGSDYTVQFANALHGEGFEIGLHSAYIWYSYYNISVAFGNQTVTYSKDSGATYETPITIPPGSYSLPDIQNYIETVLFARGDYTGTALSPVYGVKLLPNYNTLRTQVVLGAGYYLDMSIGNLYSLLGLESKIYTVSEAGASVVDITNGVTSLSLNCSIVESSYNSGISGYSIYSFVPITQPGSLINLVPMNMIFLPIAPKQITRIRIWLTDNLGRIVDLNGENSTVVLKLQKIKE